MRKREGFTLIELMIVVAIIAIIIAIALPGLIRAKMAGNERSISGSLKSVANGQETAANTLFGGNYWANNIVGLYYAESTADVGVTWTMTKFITDSGLCQADANKNAAVASGLPADPWRYAVPAGLTDKGKAGYIVWMHSTITGGVLVTGTQASYGVVAAPLRFDRSGANCYIVDEEATVYKQMWAGATSLTAGAATGPGYEAAAGLVTWPTSVQKGASWSSGGQ